jgi:hypothetical protein
MERTAPEVNVTPVVGSLARGRLGTWGIVFLVFAAMTPLVGLTSTTGLAMTLGSGIGIVGLYIVVGICVLIFQVGWPDRYLRDDGRLRLRRHRVECHLC